MIPITNIKKKTKRLRVVISIHKRMGETLHRSTEA